MIAVGGWLYNAHKQREFTKFELRTKYRIEMFEAALSGILALNDKKPTADAIISNFAAARSKIGIFGTDEELMAFEKLISAIEKSSGRVLDGENINEFPKLLVAGFRAEIGLPKRNKVIEIR